jgi:rSAM/selenodomain-associated transferase 1
MSVAPRPSRTAVLVFAKAPEPGRVKTRLVPALGEGPAAVLAARLARRTVVEVTRAGLTSVTLCATPDARHPFFELLQRHHGITLAEQGGGDLGARMHRALAAALCEHDAAILVGTDIPGLSAADLVRAAACLEDGADAVLGPAEDGGYWLIGLRRSHAFLFDDMSWGGAEVLAETRRRMDARSMRMACVAERWDVDRPEDLERLAADAVLAPLLAGLRPGPVA